MNKPPPLEVGSAILRLLIDGLSVQRIDDVRPLYKHSTRQPKQKVGQHQCWVCCYKFTILNLNTEQQQHRKEDYGKHGVAASTNASKLITCIARKQSISSPRHSLSKTLQSIFILAYIYSWYMPFRLRNSCDEVPQNCQECVSVLSQVIRVQWVA